MMTADPARAITPEPGAGDRVFVDADWLSAAPEVVPAVLVLADGGVLVPGGGHASIETDADGPGAAARVLAALAREAVSVAVERAGARIVVLGTGMVSDLCRHLAAQALVDSIEDATAAIECTGTSSAVARALAGLPDLGLLVLPGPAIGQIDLDVYDHLHRRGRQMAGVPLVASPESASGVRQDSAVEMARVRVEKLRDLPTAGGRGWFELDRSG